MTETIKTLELELQDEEAQAEGEGTPADWVIGAQQGHWTYADYFKIPNDGNRYEILEGVLYLMPSPTYDHQTALKRITYYLINYVELNNIGEVIMAPFDVDLNIGNMVQPDVMVVLNQNRKVITKANLSGAPDLVVEVASPSTGGYDRKKKKTTYAKAGVKEYWIVRPNKKTIEVFILEQGELISKGIFKGQALLPTQIVSDFPVKVAQFFE